MVNSAVFNKGSVKNIRIIRKLILLIAEKRFNKYFKRSKAEKKIVVIFKMKYESGKYYEQNCSEIGW